MTLPDVDTMNKMEAGRRLFTTTRTVESWISSGKLDTVRVGPAVYVTKASVIRMGAVMGMTEEQIMQDEGLEEATFIQQKPAKPRPTVWRQGPDRCPRCSKPTARGWCLNCAIDYD